MPKIVFVTDTNASLPADIIEKYPIITVPIHIQFEDETYTTGVDIDDARLFEIVDSQQKFPTTAAPSPDAFEKAYQKAFNDGAEHVICITCSSKVSATFNAAQLALENFPGKDITVIDSLQLSLAEGFQVIVAAEAAEKGASKEEILALVEQVQAHTHVFAALPTLKYLAMGGRMGKLAAGFGNTLEIKPILTSDEGKLDLCEKVRTWRKARQRLVELLVESTAGAAIERVGLIHVNNEEGVLSLFSLLKETLPISVEPIVADFTPGLSVHTGSGVIGVVMITRA